MDGTLKLVGNTLAYGDVGVTSNPQKRYIDWGVQRQYPVRNPKGEPFTVDPGATLTIFSGLRTITADGTTEWILTLSPLSPVRYRFEWTGTGAAPGLRTARSTTLADSVSLVVNANQTVTITSEVGSFSEVQVGDEAFIPGSTTGDSEMTFDVMNQGRWRVLARASNGSTVTLARPTGEEFTAITQTVSPADTDILFFSSSGVQINDKVVVNAGFAQAALTTYTVVAVTATWFEVTATQALPTSQVAIPGANGIQFYYAAKRYIRAEADQECVLRLNGDTGNTNKLQPWTAGDPDHTAFFEKVGPCWSAVVVNLSSEPLNFLFISVE